MKIASLTYMFRYKKIFLSGVIIYWNSSFWQWLFHQLKCYLIMFQPAAYMNTNNEHELKKQKNNDGIQDAATHKGNSAKRTKMSHKARQVSPPPQAAVAKCPRSPTVLVSEKTNLSIEKPNTLTRNWVMVPTSNLILEKWGKCRRRQNRMLLSLFATMVSPVLVKMSI